HREVVLLHTAYVDWQVVLWLIRNVLVRVSCWLAVWRHVYAEHREVACVAWPHPVVVVATELTNSGRRGAYQTHVRKALVYEQVVLVAVEEVAHVGHILTVVASLFGDSLRTLRSKLQTLFLRRVVSDTF